MIDSGDLARRLRIAAATGNIFEESSTKEGARHTMQTVGMV